MTRNKFRQLSFIIFFSLAVIILFSVFLLSSGSHRSINKQISTFKSSTEKAINYANTLLNKLAYPKYLNDPFSILYTSWFNEIAKSSNATVFINKNDSLIFWSDNSTPYPSDLNSIESGSIIFNGNGYYIVKSRQFGSFKTTALLLLKSNYFYHNNYLISRINPSLCNDCNIDISADKSVSDTLVSIDGLTEPIPVNVTEPEQTISPAKDILVVLLFFSALVLLAIAFYKLLDSFSILKRLNWLKLLFLAITPLALYIFGNAFLSFSAFKNLSINNPAYFAYSSQFTHLAPLLTAIFLVITWIAYFSKEFLLLAGKKRKNILVKVLLLLGTFLCTTLLAYQLINGIDSFLFNTSVNFTFNNILSIDIRSVLLLFTLFLLFCCIILLHYLMISLVSRLRLSFKIWLLISSVFIVTGVLFAFFARLNIAIFLGISIYLLVMQFAFSRHMYNNRVVYLLLNIILAAGITTIAINNAIRQKQHDRLKLLSLNLATEQDPLTEEFIADILPEISADSVLLNNPYKKIKNFNLTQYLKIRYFNGYLGQYLLQTTWCKPNENILIQPKDTSVSCIDFFEDMSFRFGIPTLAENVVFINNGVGRGYYLCTIKLKTPKDSSYIFAELIPASGEKGLGYPDLLVDINSGIKTIPSNIAYARYFGDDLVSRFGKYNYPTHLNHLFSSMPDETIVKDNGFIHFKLTISDNHILIITESDQDISSSLAPFSYILLFFGILTILFLFIAGRLFGFKLRFAISFSARLQWMIIVIVLIIFFVAGIISVLNLQRLNKSKNEEIVGEKAHSLVIELENKLSQFEPLTFNDAQYVTEILLKFSQVFFTDLNIYSLNGEILATTRPQIFDKQLISKQMNAHAFSLLSKHNHSFLLTTEYIGKMAFTSVYIPIRNNRNENIAYLNLPYFARENELSREISSFISTFINIYMLIIILTILITIVISNYVTQPLRLIKDKLRNIKLGTTNEKINWKRHDEIGDLIFEYNRMIEELAYKAELLARSERETAWREMAKQVAHEIKNPLTPMKLSTQYLEKAWNDKADDFDKRLKRFSQTMIEQIDSLSDIATAFSHFGKMPESTMIKICLNDVLSNVVTLYRSDAYDIILQIPDTAIYIYADESQMLRVFNNLLKNAQQAMDSTRRGIINISLSKKEDKTVVVISDNGIGISDEQKKRIFQPNFTTKSSGTGLGLAMVKNIVDGFGGNIWFESAENIGTTFSVEFPVAK